MDSLFFYKWEVMEDVIRLMNIIAFSWDARKAGIGSHEGTFILRAFMRDARIKSHPTGSHDDSGLIVLLAVTFNAILAAADMPIINRVGPYAAPRRWLAVIIPNHKSWISKLL